ncbi:hypothetical protein A33M_3677 [Rhodovulum sp. PH10]|uniref:YbaB/EbfC family nucleoid-associated protein n=1 Tax=Rhodovulum sp. PH10 TaxID=1187851 RepID=UPI00027C2E28|nr:YbaB/EbfC family nucleoid-associated protein [Rhodovulum sp. PH10]EJW10936.1 hypothetical protein A33M_3677 [Rhodovulum sp. PH10]
MANFLGLMKQAAELKGKMETLQAELEQVEVEGSAAGGLVTVVVTPKGELRKIKIDPSLMKPEEVEVLEDLIVTAHGDAKRKGDAMLAEKMQGLTGGLPLPPGMKLF